MIRKFLVVGKQIYLQSKNIESYQELGSVFELVMPIDKFWEVEGLLREANYLLATGEPQHVVHSKYREICKLAAPHAIFEKDRHWLFRRAKEAKES